MTYIDVLIMYYMNTYNIDVLLESVNKQPYLFI